MTQAIPPIDTVHLLPVLDDMLLSLLRSLKKEEWELPTVARQWRVKEVATHLLDGNIRILSMLRDGYAGEKADIQSYGQLVEYLNGLNADWVKAMKRVSPEMLILLHEITGPLFCRYYASLDPFEKAVFPVAWAGEAESRNWMHIGREYTEKFLHQQQIRDAVGKPGLLVSRFHHPFMHVFMQALPYIYRAVDAPAGSCLEINITGNAGGKWWLVRENEKWVPGNNATAVTTRVSIPQEEAWKLFSKSIRADAIAGKIRIQGDKQLAEPALNMVSVMA
ncbi:maleylpyruvate isomerase N-terminal domain-containing protein [Sediminibacterium soli]|uniref:maleylpyruvate isomerase N-terminal domain-containing protein n=1 Tax=Sediminibacterium soli TaxID=2698829 RepID=UPI00137B78A6|nr:maleylpyruvate isomerase N-terminal domain-containing protein [Sediminibacterium soli]NCI47111.1 hypothetical protein [Sediminibacterium soli]